MDRRYLLYARRTLLSLVSLATMVCVGSHRYHSDRTSYEATYAPVSSAELDALHELFVSTDGENWQWDDTRGARWNFTSSANPCEDEWQGVFCSNVTVDSFSIITELSLPGYFLVGPLPQSISNLTSLTLLDLSTNSISSTLPSALCNLSQLGTLTLAYNNIIGPLPPCLGSALPSLEILQLNNNHLTGEIPPWTANNTIIQEINLGFNSLNGSLQRFARGYLTSLHVLNVASNQVDGEIPAALLNAGLVTLNLANNLLTGRIPHTDTGLLSLVYLNLLSNQLTGPIPASIGNFASLQYLYLNKNMLSRALPEEITNLAGLLLLDVASNLLTGSLPGGLTHMHLLQTFNIQDNQISGNLHSGVCDMQALTFLYLANNRLSGTIPTCIGGAGLLKYLYINNNYLRGSIPASIGSLSRLQTLNVSDNWITGTLPGTLSCLAQLQVMLLEDNALSGCLTGVFNASVQRNLSAVQLSNNQLTGALPDELFRLPGLNVFAAVSNCFEGSIPASICNRTTLATLALDGLHAATSCQKKLLPGLLMRTSAYIVGQPIHDGIPACLFAMPRLVTLHLSGNGLTGSLPDDLEVSPSMTELSLSHNYLVGNIPEVIQRRAWDTLDLSYNCFGGTLSTDFSSEYTANSTLYLEQNRLSGRIPHTVVDIADISILGSNLFACDADRTDLPDHDGDKNTYQCGSDAMNSAAYTWLILVTAAFFTIAVLWRWRKEFDETCFNVSDWAVSLQAWWNSVSTARERNIAPTHLRNLTESAQTYAVLCKLAIYCTIAIIACLLPLYVVLDAYYATLSHKFAWTASAAFLSGQVPFSLELVAYTFLMTGVSVGLLYLLHLREQRNTAAEEASPTPIYTESSSVVHPTLLAYIFVACIFVLINFSASAGANIAYVYVALNKSDRLLGLAQILLSAFKFSLNTLVSPYLIHLLSEIALVTVHQSKDGETAHFAAADFVSVQLFVALFNTIAIPCIVVAIINPSCFVDAFVAAPAVESSFTYRGGCVTDQQSDQNQATLSCVGYEILQASTSYSPPFAYSYQCSSSFITYYAPTYANLCIMASFVAPLGQVIIQWLHARARKGTLWFAALHAVLPRSLRPLDAESGDSTSPGFHSYPPFFNAAQLLVSILTYFGVLLTFGVVFPPLAVTSLLTILSVTAFGRWKVGRLLFRATQLNLMAVVDAVDKECRGIGSAWILRRSVRMVIAFAWCFYTLFLFDTLGDQTGFRGAYWVLIVMPSMPLVMFSVYKAWGWTKHLGGNIVAQSKEFVESAEPGSGDDALPQGVAKELESLGETFNVLAEV